MTAVEHLDALARQLAEATVGGDAETAARLRGEFALALGPLAGSHSSLSVNLTEVAAGDLPEAPGVYVIKASDLAYVGLATDLHHRFHNTDYGHLTPNNRTRSREVLAKGNATINLIPLEGLPFEPDALRLALSHAEIHTYAQLVMSGLSVTNAISTLGRTSGSPSSPVVLCRLDKGDYIYCDSIMVAQKVVGSSAIPAVLHGYQRTAVGYTVRWATAGEAEAIGDDLPDEGFLDGASIVEIVALETSRVEWEGTGRNAKYVWSSGPLSDADREHLLKYGRASYDVSTPKSGFLCVDRVKGGGWHIRAKREYGRAPMWQQTNRTWTALEAAIAREEQILAQGWQAFNFGRYASNADAINAALGENRYTAW